MGSYNIPFGKSGVNEAAYQTLVRRALADHKGPVLIAPRWRIRGSAWKGKS